MFDSQFSKEIKINIESAKQEVIDKMLGDVLKSFRDAGFSEENIIYALLANTDHCSDFHKALEKLIQH
ncbi:MAG: hypothetical protein AB4290_24965 [Spirulina sp.]